MSARVLNPAMMTEMSRNLGGGGGGGGRPVPSRAALARVRRDLFGPVDHAAARALADRELRAQSALDSDRWGFDFHLEIPRSNSRYEWEPVTAQDVVPEPYALRGMPYLRKHAPGTPPRKSRADEAAASAAAVVAATSPTTMLTAMMITTTTATTTTTTTMMTTTTSTRIVEQTAEASAAPTAASMMMIDAVERTPPQEPRVPEIGDATTPSQVFDADASRRKRCPREPTTPVLPPAARKQSAITDYMKSRKRGLNGTTKSMIEPPEKITRNAGQIRS